MMGVDKHECPLVFVEWEDSAQPAPSWVYLANFEEPTAVKCVSVGWLIHDGDDVKALAPNMGEVDDDENLQVSGVMRIPARCVSRIVRLSEPD
jgi:hypothetical protein